MAEASDRSRLFVEPLLLRTVTGQSSSVVAALVLRTSSMVDVKENSNGVALLEEKVMAALTQLIVSSLLEKEKLESKG